MDDRYYSEEINYLLEHGKEFARQHPDKARMLHLDDIRSRDPNVERLIESFAFLTSRIRKRLDDDFSQIADGLLSLIWPGYVNPVPSFCIMEFRPPLWEFTEALEIPAGAEIDSNPCSHNIRCRFRTCFPTVALPMELSGVSVDSAGSTSDLDLTFNLAKDTNLSSLYGHKLKVQLVGEFFICWKLYNLLLGKNETTDPIDNVKVTALGDKGEEIASRIFDADVISAVGLTREESLLPTGKTSLWSFGLIRDFFIFPEKFQAFNLDILDWLSKQPGTATFTVSIRINNPWPTNVRMKKEFLRINTVPIVNLFNRDANPVRLDRLHHRYTVRGDVKNPEFYQVYSVDNVEGIEVGSAMRKKYSPLYTSRSKSTTDGTSKSYYTLERSNSSWGGLETYISFVDFMTQNELPEEEVISLSLTCTNGRLPNELLPDQITDPVSQVIDSLRPTNISHPTQFVLPDIEKDTLWRWLSHASLNYMSLGSKDQFKSLLRLHDFSSSEANRHKIEGIKTISMSSVKALIRGALVPGISVNIIIEEDHFTELGEIQLFAKVLSSFMSSYASINSYIQLSLTLEPSDHKIVIQPKFGENFQL